ENVKLTNYTLEGGEHTVDILRKEITLITGITVRDRQYDGTTEADLVFDRAIFHGMVENDILTVADATGTFASPDAGEREVSITGLVLGGRDAHNYTLGDDTAS